jgi:hypothetical protein
MTPATLTLLLLAAPTERTPPSLAELAVGADLVAVAQLIHTEYRPREGPPEAGFALLRLLIPYKRPDSQEVVAVYAERGQAAACFYPLEPDADERYLVFLRRRDDGQYEGEPPYCRLPVHVIASDGEYALRWPLEGIAPPEGLQAEALVFADRAAHLDPGRLAPAALEEALARWPTERLTDGRFRFTHGLRLTAIRPHIFPDGLPPPPHRQTRHPQPDAPVKQE